MRKIEFKLLPTSTGFNDEQIHLPTPTNPWTMAREKSKSKGAFMEAPIRSWTGSIAGCVIECVSNTPSTHTNHNKFVYNYRGLYQMIRMCGQLILPDAPPPDPFNPCGSRVIFLVVVQTSILGRMFYTHRRAVGLISFRSYYGGMLKRFYNSAWNGALKRVIDGFSPPNGKYSVMHVLYEQFQK